MDSHSRHEILQNFLLRLWPPFHLFLFPPSLPDALVMACSLARSKPFSYLFFPTSDDVAHMCGFNYHALGIDDFHMCFSTPNTSLRGPHLIPYLTCLFRCYKSTSTYGTILCFLPAPHLDLSCLVLYQDVVPQTLPMGILEG